MKIKVRAQALHALKSCLDVGFEEYANSFLGEEEVYISEVERATETILDALQIDFKEEMVQAGKIIGSFRPQVKETPKPRIMDSAQLSKG